MVPQQLQLPQQMKLPSQFWFAEAIKTNRFVDSTKSFSSSKLITNDFLQ